MFLRWCNFRDLKMGQIHDLKVLRFRDIKIEKFRDLDIDVGRFSCAHNGQR